MMWNLSHTVKKKREQYSQKSKKAQKHAMQEHPSLQLKVLYISMQFQQITTYTKSLKHF